MRKITDKKPPYGEVVCVEGGIAYLGLDDKWYSLAEEAYPGREILWDVSWWAWPAEMRWANNNE